MLSTFFHKLTLLIHFQVPACSTVLLLSQKNIFGKGKDVLEKR